MTYRPEIDGLRAVAVLAVLLFHAGGILPGGYAGVDVFFVISGYVITGVLSAELARGGFTLAGFYERRVRRIAPALLATIGITAAVAPFVLLPPDLDAFGESAVAAALMVANVHFWLEAGYFDTESLTKPLLHTWSLGIEEQFYLVYPLLLAALWRRARRAVVPVLLALFVISLAASVWAVAEKPQAAFFLAPFRVWELLLGALIALRPLPRLRFGSPMAGLGIAMIGAAYLLYDDSVGFPGLAALLPTVGAALVIACAREGTRAAQILGAPLLVAVGRISYSLYLVHWPLIALIEYRGGDPVQGWESVAVIALSLAIAALSYVYVEQPFRRPARFGAYWRVFGAATAATAVACAVGASFDMSDGMAGQMPANVRAAFAAGKDVWKDGDRCFVDTKGRSGPTPDDIRSGRMCRFGAASAAARPDFVIWGDSHAASMAPAILTSAGRHGASGAFVGAGSCPPLPGYDTLDVRDRTERRCHETNAAALDYVEAQRPAYVFLVARWPKYALGSEFGNEGYFFDPRKIKPPVAGEDVRLEAALDATLARLRAAGVTPVLVMDTPEPGYDVPYATARELLQNETPNLAPARSAVAARQARPLAILTAVAGRHGGEVIDPTPAFCDDATCRVERDGVLLYSDEDHISLTAATELSGLYDPLFAELARRRPDAAKSSRPAAP
ncbi:acyltransferase family protein [Hansschlegelia sp. KR7-227]|uniref:acyltransferase family protein n=1 Tax=Hansschlegelia sp. KR7-227 TaxID=3400914 RepID=UPI003BFC6B96